MSFKREMAPGDRWPMFYGMAYYDHRTLRVVLYPIPCNLVVAVLRGMWLWCAFYLPHWIGRQEERIFKAGWDAGFNKGRFIHQRNHYAE